MIVPQYLVLIPARLERFKVAIKTRSRQAGRPVHPQEWVSDIDSSGSLSRKRHSTLTQTTKLPYCLPTSSGWNVSGTTSIHDFSRPVYLVLNKILVVHHSETTNLEGWYWLKFGRAELQVLCLSATFVLWYDSGSVKQEQPYAQVMVTLVAPSWIIES